MDPKDLPLYNEETDEVEKQFTITITLRTWSKDIRRVKTTVRDRIVHQALLDDDEAQVIDAT